MFARQRADLVGLGIDLLDHLRRPQELLLPSVDRFGAAPQTLSHLANRVAPILDLCARVAPELSCEFSSGHLILLASKIIKQGV